jgi:hypothetical protein
VGCCLEANGEPGFVNCVVDEVNIQRWDANLLWED